jgi:hypothetical protein
MDFSDLLTVCWLSAYQHRGVEENGPDLRALILTLSFEVLGLAR